MDVTFLDNYATRKWEAILHFMVGTGNELVPGKCVTQLLQESGLMEKCASYSLVVGKLF